MIIGGSHLSDKITKAEKIHNYPGLIDITGAEFTQKLQAQLQAAGLTITQQKAIGIYPMQDKIGVATQEGGYFEAKTVILANGVESVKQIDGEMEFAGRGVSYCATCDGFLYKDKTIAVLCTSKRLEEEITLLPRSQHMPLDEVGNLRSPDLTGWCFAPDYTGEILTRRLTLQNWTVRYLP